MRILYKYLADFIVEIKQTTTKHAVVTELPQTSTYYKIIQCLLICTVTLILIADDDYNINNSVLSTKLN